MRGLFLFRKDLPNDRRLSGGLLGREASGKWVSLRNAKLLNDEEECVLMLDIRWMRENREALADAMRKLNDPTAPWEKALTLDEERRELLTKVELLRAERNSGSKQVGLLMRDKKND